MGLVQRPINPESPWELGRGSPKNVAKAHGNVRMEWAKDAQRNEMRQGNPRWHED